MEQRDAKVTFEFEAYDLECLLEWVKTAQETFKQKAVGRGYFRTTVETKVEKR